MKLLEIVRGKDTAPDVLATAIAVGRKIGKVPVVVGVCHGFVGNRMLSARGIEAEKLLLEGALPQDVDGALTEFGFPMGPFAMGDLAGLDVGWRRRKGAACATRSPTAWPSRAASARRPARASISMRAARARPDPEVEKLIVDASVRMGVKRRNVRRGDRRAADLPDGQRRRAHPRRGHRDAAGDIDVVWLYGYGFPAWRGGPMHWADTVGLKKIRDRLPRWRRRPATSAMSRPHC